jgi:hypothetical protein
MAGAHSTLAEMRNVCKILFGNPVRTHHLRYIGVTLDRGNNEVDFNEQAARVWT